jgi:hypothetical protein
MFSRGHHTAIFIVTKFMLLLLKDLLAKLIITCTLKDKLTTWLCLVEGYLASIHDWVSFKIEHMICSRMRCIAKENTIDRPGLKLIQLLPFLKNEALAIKDMEVTHLGCATVHQLVESFLVMHPEVDPVRHIARGIHRLSQYLLGVLCSSSIVRAISHNVLFFLSTTPFWGGVYGLENWCSRPVSWQKVSKREFLNSEPLSLRNARVASPRISFLNLKTRSRKKPNVSPLSSRKNTHAY